MSHKPSTNPGAKYSKWTRPSRREFIKASLALGAGLAVMPALAPLARAQPGEGVDKAADLERRIRVGGLAHNEEINLKIRLADACRRQGLHRRECEVLTEVLGASEVQNFKRRFATLHYGRALYHTGQFKESLQVLDELAGQSFKFRPETLYSAAVAAIACRDPHLALDYVERIEQYYPETGMGRRAQLLKGRVQLRLGRARQAVQTLKTCLALPSHEGKRAAEHYFWLTEALLKCGEVQRARAAAEQMLELAPQLTHKPEKAALRSLQLRHRAATLFWNNAQPAAALEIIEPIANEYAQLRGKPLRRAAGAAAKAYTLAGRCWRALDNQTKALEAFKMARQLATPLNLVADRRSGLLMLACAAGYASPEPEIVHALTAQAEMALQTEDPALLGKTLAEGETLGSTASETRELYDTQMASKLQAFHEKAQWRPLSKRLVEGGYATANARLQESLDLRRSLNIDGDHAQAAGYLKLGVEQAEFDNPVLETDLHLLLARELDAAGDAAGRDEQIAWVEKFAGTLASDSDNAACVPWLHYRAGRTWLALEGYENALAKFRAVIAGWPATDEAKKSRFMLAEALLGAGDAQGAIDAWLGLAVDSGVKPEYAIQAAVQALEAAEQYPGAVIDASVLGALIDDMLALTGADWRSLLNAAKYFYYNDQKSRVTETLKMAFAALEETRDANGIEPFSDAWLLQEARVLDVMKNVGRTKALIARVDAIGVENYYIGERTHSTTKALYMILAYYQNAQRNRRELEISSDVRKHMTEMFANESTYRIALLQYKEIASIWRNDSFAAAQELADDMLLQHPAHFQTHILRLYYSLALVTDGDYAAAIDMIEPVLSFRCPARGPGYLSRLQGNARYVKGYCLAQLGSAAEGEAIMNATKADGYTRTAIKSGLPRR